MTRHPWVVPLTTDNGIGSKAALNIFWAFLNTNLKAINTKLSSPCSLYPSGIIPGRSTTTRGRVLCSEQVGKVKFPFNGMEMFPAAGKTIPGANQKVQNPPEPQTSLVGWVLSSTFERKQQIANHEPILQGGILSLYREIHIKKILLNSFLGERE